MLDYSQVISVSRNKLDGDVVLDLNYRFLDSYSELIEMKFHKLCTVSAHTWSTTSQMRVAQTVRRLSVLNSKEFQYLQLLFNRTPRNLRTLNLIMAGEDAQFELKESGLQIPASILTGYITFYAKNNRRKINITFRDLEYESYTILYIYDRVIDFLGNRHNMPLARFVLELLYENPLVAIDSERSSWLPLDPLPGVAATHGITTRIASYLTSDHGLDLNSFTPLYKTNSYHSIQSLV